MERSWRAGAGQGLSGDLVPLVVDLGRALSSQDLAITVFRECSAELFLTSVLPRACHWHTGFAALPSSRPKLLCNAASVVVPNGKHPSSISIHRGGCEGVLKIRQALQVGRQVGVILLLLLSFLISFCSFLVRSFITEHIKLLSVASCFEFGCVFFSPSCLSCRTR